VVYIPIKLRNKLDKVFALAQRPGTISEGISALNVLEMLCKKHNIDPTELYGPLPHYREGIQPMLIHLDFETFSESPLKDVGAWTYAHHTSTEAICAAWSYDDDEPDLWTPFKHPVHDWPYLEKLLRYWKGFNKVGRYLHGTPNLNIIYGTIAVCLNTDGLKFH
jgi:hypothetical protein